MKKSEIKKHLTKIVIPFTTEISLKEENEPVFAHVWDPQETRIGMNVQSHVKAFLLDSKNFQLLRLNHKRRNDFGLPHSPSNLMKVERGRNGLSHTFRLKDVELLLFDGIGFLTLHVEVNTNSIADIAAANRLLKNSINGFSNVKIFYVKKLDINTEEYVDINLKDIVNDLVSPFSTDGAIFDTYLYTTAVVDCENTDEYLAMQLRDDLLTLTSGSYSMLSGDKDDLVSYIRNSYWKISLEGAACINVLAEDRSEMMNIIYPGTLIANFNLMILALYQRLYLMKFYSVASTIDVNKEAVINVEKQLALFKLKACFSQISNISGIQFFYETFRSVFRVEQIVSEVYREIQDLSTLVRQQLDREEQDERERGEKRNRVISIFVLSISTIFVMISTSNDGWSIANLLDQPAVPDNPLAYKLFIGVIIGTWGVFPLLLILLFVILNKYSKNK